MPNKVRDVHDRKALYMSDLRKSGRIPVTFHSIFKSVQHSDEWVVDLEWAGERRYLTLDSQRDRESFLRLGDEIAIEIESVGHVGVDKIAIYQRGIRIDVHADHDKRKRGKAAVGQPNPGCPTIPLPVTLERTTIDQVCVVYERVYAKALPMVSRLDPTGEQGLTAANIAYSILTAYTLANQFAPRPAKCHPDEAQTTGAPSTVVPT